MDNLYTFIRLSGHSPEDNIDKHIIEVYENRDEYRLVVFNVTTARLNRHSKRDFEAIKTIREAKNADDLYGLFGCSNVNMLELVTTLSLTFEMLDKTPIEILAWVAAVIETNRERKKQKRRR
jgi:hypothetical protein